MKRERLNYLYDLFYDSLLKLETRIYMQNNEKRAMVLKTAFEEQKEQASIIPG